MTQNDFLPAPEPEAPHVAIDDFESLKTRIRELEQETADLRAGLESRQRLGFITGVLAQRYDLDPDQAWNLLTRLSQHLNVKVRRVAQVLLDAYRGELDTTDAALAASITRLLSQAAWRGGAPRGNDAAGSYAGKALPHPTSPDSQRELQHHPDSSGSTSAMTRAEITTPPRSTSSTHQEPAPSSRPSGRRASETRLTPAAAMSDHVAPRHSADRARIQQRALELTDGEVAGRDDR